MSAYDAAGWQNFYVMVGGAAAALTGLLFVAMSLHSKAIIADPLHASRAVGTLLSLMTQLFVAGF
jgi:modulator of FtsH protease